MSPGLHSACQPPIVSLRKAGKRGGAHRGGLGRQKGQEKKEKGRRGINERQSINSGKLGVRKPKFQENSQVREGRKEKKEEGLGNRFLEVTARWREGR